MSSLPLHQAMANAIRSLSMDGVEKAKSGHPGLPMGAADIATVLFTRFLKFDPADPAWPDRDRFILSAGHGSMLLYALLYLTGTKGMALDDLKNFRQMGSKTPGHPEFGHTLGVEVTTGPLGQGLATSVGFALGERIMAANFSDDLVDHHTYVLASDGDLMEGISQEAIALAGHLKLSRLIVLWDDNGISIDGPLSIADSVDQLKRFESTGWNATRVDGHDHDAIAAAITAAQSSDRPTLIACKTIIGYGAPKRAGTSKAHGEPLGAEELAGAKAALGLSPEPFDVPADVLNAWRDLSKRSQPMHASWLKRLAASAHRAEFERRIAGKLPAGFDQAIAELKSRLAAEPQTLATRKSSELALETITAVVPELILGSADLTPSNNTKTKNLVA
ncbi:MAG: transketolase, partial [Pseudomonadota bacterium]